MTELNPVVHVLIGTKAQYIKTAPLLRLMDSEGVEYRLVDTGQHGKLSAAMRESLGVREPDLFIGGNRDVTSIRQALVWAARLATRLFSRAKLRKEVFGGRHGIGIVHGDTPSTLLTALMTKRAGLKLGHIESGVRSHRLTHPFPEEIIRLLVMRMGSFLFAPEASAEKNLSDLRVKGEIVPTGGNTSIEALIYSLGDVSVTGDGPVVVTMHRVENLHSGKRVDQLIDTVVRIASNHSVRFVVHEPTQSVLDKHGRMERLEAAGVEMTPLVGHREFVSMIAAAPFVITDGGSIHEECAMLGVPTLLWRDRYEHSTGIGTNVVVSHYDPATITSFLEDPQRHRRPLSIPETTPSSIILHTVQGDLANSTKA